MFAKFGPNFTFKGKTVLVTGGSAGIGVETVRGFASKGRVSCLSICSSLGVVLLLIGQKVPEYLLE